MMLLNEKDAENLGNAIVVLLGLKVKSNGRVDTSSGDKTPIGLGRAILKMVEDKTKLPDHVPFRVDIELGCPVSMEYRKLVKITQGRLQEAVSKIANSARSDAGALAAVVRPNV